MFTSVFVHNCGRYIVDSASWPIVADALDGHTDLPLLHLVYPPQSSRWLQAVGVVRVEECRPNHSFSINEIRRGKRNLEAVVSVSRR